MPQAPPQTSFLRLPHSDRHEPLLPVPWDEAQVKATIEEIVASTYKEFEPESFWPSHPLDENGGQPSTSLYFGAAGTIWALDYLDRVGVAPRVRDFAETAEQLLKQNRLETQRMPYPDSVSYLMGDIAPLLLKWKLTPSQAVLDQLFKRITASAEQPVLEFMWGVPGTMLVCVFVAEWTGETRWTALFRQLAQRVWSEWQEDARYGHVWTQELYGDRQQYLGPIHGFAGNVFPFLRGRSLLEPAQLALVYERTARTIVKTACEDETGANWLPIIGPADAESIPVLVQYCHGAPGMVIALAQFPPGINPGLDRLLEKGGEFTWRVGPLTKGSGLCHGTAGNGYAFLKLYKRTGQAVWLERARAFAMHAIEQWRFAYRKYQRGRYTLWTGDLGLAVYLWDCLRGEAAFPCLDVF